MDFKNLVEQAQNGNSNAWTELFKGTKDMVYFTALKLSGNKSSAEDIVQEVYIKAIENISSLRAPEAFVVWMRTIAVNVSRNHLAKTSPTVFGSDESDEILLNTPEVDEDFLPAECASRRETARIIMRIIDSLPEKQRITVILYYYNEVPVAEIARMMNVSENTVKSRLNYARVQIKEQVEDLEKKGTKLRGAVPFLGLALREAAKDYVLSQEAAVKIAATFTATAGTAAAATTATAAATTATTATTGGIIAKIAALPLVTKIIAGVLGVAVAVGGTAAIINTVTDSDKSESVIWEDFVQLTKEQQKEYSELDMLSLFAMTREDIEATFGTEYEIYDKEYEYFLEYTFAHDNGYDVLIFEFEESEGAQRPIDVQMLGNLFTYGGICTDMSFAEVKKNLEDRGFVLVMDVENSDEWGIYNEVEYLNQNDDVSVYMMHQNGVLQNITLWYEYEEPIETTEPIATTEVPVETTEAPVETTVPIETTAPVETTAPEAEVPAKKTLLYTFKQNELLSQGINETYVPYIKVYSDGTFEGQANIYYAVVAVKGTWKDNGDGNYTMSIISPSRCYEFNVAEFNLYYTSGKSYGVVTFYPGDSMGMTVDGATFDFIGETPAPDSTTNEGAHKILEEFRLNNRTNSDGSISYAYADLTHDGIEELIVMTNSRGATVDNPSAEAYYEVFTLKGGIPTRIFKAGTGFTTNSMYMHYLYTENGKAYLMEAAFFERQGSPWYFYEIYSLDASGNKISYKGRDVSLNYGYTDSSPLDLVMAEYKECLKSSNVLVIPVSDDDQGFAATTGWWYKDYR